MSYTFRKLNKENIGDLIYLYKHVFNKIVDIDYMNLKHDTSVFGASYIGFLAYAEDNEPAAFYGVFACEIVYDGKNFLAAQSGDTMTHPKHARKGLFTQLALITYDYCKEIGVHLVFGFPNNNSYPGFVQKLDWVHFDDIEAYTLKVRTISFYRMNKWFKMSEEWHQKRGDRILSSCTKGKAFQSSCFTENTPVIDHSENFFKYKLYEKNYLIQVEGINVWLKFNTNFLFIGDIELASEAVWNKVINALQSIAAKMFIPHLRFQGSTETPLANYFLKIGQKLENTHAIGGVNFSGKIPLEKMKFTAADNDTF